MPEAVPGETSGEKPVAETRIKKAEIRKIPVKVEGKGKKETKR